MIMEAAHGFWKSCALCTACEMGLFTKLGEGPQTAEALADRTRTSARALSMILNANTALGFLQKRADRYANAPVAEAFLVKGREGYLGDTVLHMAGALYPGWAHLTTAVKRGRPVRGLPPASPPRETARDFTLAMHGVSTHAGRFLAKNLDLRRYRRLLDIGGGSGVLSAKLAERFGHLEATVLDLPEVCKVAAELCRASSAAARLKTRPQSYLDPLPRGHDVALLSQILHAEDESVCRDLLRRVYEAIESPGLIIVLEFALNREKTGPLFPALFSLNMLINTDAGAAFSVNEILAWLREAGFRKARPKKMPGYATLFTAEKL